MSGWEALAGGLAILAAAGVRELVRWRGRRWQKSGPRGTDDPPAKSVSGPG